MECGLDSYKYWNGRNLGRKGHRCPAEVSMTVGGVGSCADSAPVLGGDQICVSNRLSNLSVGTELEETEAH